MRKLLVIKNTENNKYFTGDYNNWWSLDIDDARTYKNDADVEKEIKEQTNTENDLDAFEDVTCVIIETIYKKD